MSKKERVNSTITFLIALIIAVLTALFGVVGFAVVNHNTLNNDRVIFWSVIVGAVLLIVGLIILSLWMAKNLKRLEKMK